MEEEEADQEDPKHYLNERSSKIANPGEETRHS
jgi:hypothetical protein